MNTTPQLNIKDVLINLTSTFIEQHQVKYQCLPKVEFESEWPSLCQQGTAEENYIYWQPIIADDELTFTNVETALEILIHQDIKDYFTCLYSESIPVECSQGYLELLFAWNNDDFERLQQNIIGHILMKKKLKQDMTIFFAVTDDDDVIVSIDNVTGEVWAEKVGCQPHKKLADSLVEFLSTLVIKL